VPEDLLEDTEELRRWVAKALAVAAKKTVKGSRGRGVK
jgi:TfoX/Sxy family transcriptional regulator of competence genes